MKSFLSYGILAAVIVIAFKLVIYFLHMQLTALGIFMGIFSIALMFIPLFSAIKNKRDKELGGYITLRQGMRVGLVISAVAGLLVGIFTYVFYKYIDLETYDLVMERIMDQLHKANATQAQIDAEIIFQKEFYSPMNQAIKGGLFSILGAGFVLSFICSTFLVKKPAE